MHQQVALQAIKNVISSKNLSTVESLIKQGYTLTNFIRTSTVDDIERFIILVNKKNNTVIKNNFLKNQNKYYRVDKSPPYPGDYLMHMAVRKKKDSMLKILIKWGFDVNIKNDDKNEYGENNQLKSSPLHVAAETANYNAVALLCDAGADINALDTKKMTPLACATFNAENKKMMDKLVKKGASKSVGGEHSAEKMAQHYGIQDPEVKNYFSTKNRTSNIGIEERRTSQQPLPQLPNTEMLEEISLPKKKKEREKRSCCSIQ